MLRMAQINHIKELYEKQEKSLREIARITGHSFATVQKYAHRNDWNQDFQLKVKEQNYPILGEYIATIDEWLEADRKIPKKQRHTRWRIYCRLRDEYGYKGSYSSVKRYIRRKKFATRDQKEGYLPLAHPAGDAQADFGEFLYYDGKGREKKAYALTLSFPQSNMGYTQVFPSQNQECLLEGLKRIFEHIGGVPRKIRFDNMKTAVVRMLEGHERVLTDGFHRFQLHYRFEAEFCNLASGNEKGNVENKVGYSRRNFFVPIPTITSFDEFNEGLWERCEKDAQRPHYKHKVFICELWKADKDALLQLPEYPYSVFRYKAVVVNKTGFVMIDSNRYGLPPLFSGETVQAKIFYDHIEFFHDHKAVGTYRRSYGTNEEIYDWTQYVSALCRKPSAIEGTRFFHKMPERWQEYLKKVHGTERKSALQLLNEMVNDGNAALCDDALELLTDSGRSDPDSLRQCYYIIAKKEYHPKPLELPSSPTFHYNPDLSAYDDLMGGEKHV